MGQLLFSCLMWEMDCSSLFQCMERFGNQGLCKSSSVDVVDFLPSDPFRMDFADYHQDFDSGNGEFDGKLGEFDGKALGYSIDKFFSSGDFYDGSFVNESRGIDRIFFRDDADILPSDPFGMNAATAFWGFTESLKGLEDIDWSFEKTEFEEDDDSTSDGVIFGLNLVCRPRVNCVLDAKKDEVDLKPNSGEPHFAMFLALRYLGVKDLLSVEMVCRSLNHAVRSDSSLWMNINVGALLHNRLTDDLLVRLTSRAHGRLKALTLFGCFRITNAGISRVIEGNRGLMKLSVPNCFRLSIDEMLTTLKSTKPLALKQLRIRGLSGITNEHYEQLRVLVSANDQFQSQNHKPLYYHHNYQSYPDDDRAIDIEKCLRCNELRIVYDCPAESCQRNEVAAPCKACPLCITRCISCGCCLTNCDYTETFVLDNLCFDCCVKIASRQEGLAIFEGPNYLFINS